MNADPSLRRNPRERAVRILIDTYTGEARCQDLLARMQSESRISDEDAAMAAELCLGVSRHRITCEHIASRFYRGRWLGLRVPIRVILATGTYQLCWMDRIPDHAAVDQAVRQAKRHGKGTAAMVNAILRKVAAARGDAVPVSDELDPRRYLPLDTTRGRMFSESIFPDPSRKPLDYLVAATGHPPWLVERWHRRFKPKMCRVVCDAGARRPMLCLRPNRIRVSAEGLRLQLVEEGHVATLTDGDHAVLVENAPPVTRLAAFQAGMCQPQDATAQVALQLAPPEPGDLVVDLCAGVGTKSTQAAEMMNNSGRVLATDASDERLSRIADSAHRLGLSNIRAVPLAEIETALAAEGRPPALILVDAPCLNTGVLARRPEARYRASHKALQSIAAVQAAILDRAAGMADAATRMIYTTCSLEEEENERQVAAFCERHSGWRVNEQRLTLPGPGCDGGFAAVLTH